jgi:hypothetical protein
MKLARPLLGLTVVIALVFGPGSAMAQRRGVINPPNPQALSALQTDLVNAIDSMKSALPIYDGNRVRSIRAAHAALVIVDRAISGAQTKARPMPTVNDAVGSKGAKGKYTQAQISASQTNMTNGLASLQTAWKDMQVAAGSNPNQRAKNAANHLQVAITEAKTAISLHPIQP